MAEKRISELTAKGTTLATTDLIEISESDGLGGYVTKRVTGQNIFDGVSTSNFANANLTFTANRTHNANTYTLTFNNIGDLKYNSNVTGHLLGYYDLGNGRPEFVLDCPSGGQTWMRIKNNTTDVRNTITIGTTLWEQLRELQWRSIVTNNIQMVRDIDGRYLFSNDATGLDTPDSDTRMKIASDGLDFALKTDAKVRMTNLPTSAAGLSTGDLWNNGGVINIV